MEQFNFSDEEIKYELAKLGYKDLSNEIFAEFKLDLNRLVELDRSKDTSQNSILHSTTHETSLASQSDSIPKEVMRDSGGFVPKSYRQQTKDHFIQTNLLSEYGLPKRVLFHSQSDDQAQKEDVSEHQISPRFDQDEFLTNGGDDVQPLKRYVRRKTSRKTSDGSRSVSESMTESEPGDLGEITDRLREVAFRPVYLSNSYSTLPRCISADAPYRLQPDHNRIPSVIYPSFDHPHTRNLRRADPVARFHETQRLRSLNRIPGQDDHRDVRWQIREFMVQRDPLPKKPQKTFVPNTYVPPPDKKRSSLRWQLRMDLAHGNLPLNRTDGDYLIARNLEG